MPYDTENVSWQNWETVGEIGSGSYGTVYKIQRSIFDNVETAALKFIRIPQKDSDIRELDTNGLDKESITGIYEEYLKDIVKEYNLMATLKGHPNIVQCEDIQYSRHDDGIGWDIKIKMELLTPLSKVIGNNAVGEKTAEKIARDLCSALVICEEKNILHRDIKPQNIFVSDHGNYKLGDFGIAKVVEKTMGGTKVGTYRYMAPEVYHNQPYGTAADIYSLGLVLYWLLNDRRLPFLPPFPGMVTVSINQEAMNRRLSGEALPPPAHGSDELKAIVLKACEFDPDNRFHSAEEMLDALERIRVKPPEPHVPMQDEDGVGTIDDSGSPEKKNPDVGTDGTKRNEHKYINETKEQTKQQYKEAQKLQHKGGKMKLIAAVAAIVMIVAAVCAAILVPHKSSIVRPTISAGKLHSVALRKNGKVVATGNNAFGQCDVSDWRNIVSVAVGGSHTVGLKNDGTVVATGNNGLRQCEVSDWTDIVAISAGAVKTHGLKSNGTVVETGYPKRVSGWNDVVAIGVGIDHVVGLKSNGTVIATSNGGYIDLGQCDTSDWNDISEICIGDFITVGLKHDGTVVATGSNFYGQCDISDWTDITAISTGVAHTVGLKRDGTVIAAGDNGGGQCDITGWEKITAISAGGDHTVGLKRDGTVVATGLNDHGQCEVSDWADIVAVSAGRDFTVGLKANGEIVKTS